jgi:DNA mismatch endonuclease, patch repair protein
MTDIISNKERSAVMSKIRSANTKPELLVRKFLCDNGFRYRKNLKTLPGTPDIVIRKCRTVVMVNGCFWHGHEGCKKFSMPKTRVEFWSGKIERNRQRDVEAIEKLQRLGWDVVVIWECQLMPKRRTTTLNALLDVIYRNLLEEIVIKG